MAESIDAEKNRLDEKALAEKQALKYAEDLAVIYREEKARRKALEVANEKIRAVVDSMSDGMLATDEKYIIIEANQIVCQLLETKKEDLLGQNLIEFLDMPELKDRLLQVKEPPEAKGRFELEMDLLGGRTVRVSASMVQDNKGYVFVLHDVSAEKRAENLKNEFLSILSHELRTPLNAILGFSEILSDELAGKIDQDHSEHLEIIQTSGKRMLDTVEELLEFAQLQSEGLESLDERVQVEHLINDVFSTLKEQSNEKDIKLDFRTKAENPTVTGNKSMLKDLFSHIIQNAIIFGEQGGRVSVEIDEGGASYKISIVDDGIGIPASDLGKVFNSFYQVEEHMTRNQDGLGLGLSLSKHIAELHGGGIKIESKIDKGTTCIITLPKAV